MMVFTSRIHCAYLEKRSKKGMALATLLLLAIIGACGIAGSEEQDRQAMSDQISSASRKRIVARWTASENSIIPIDIPQGEQAKAR